MKIKKSVKIIISLFFLILIISNTFAQQNSIYNLTIKDENDVEIGQYFDIQMDGISITSDTTLNFQIIPNIEIQDPMFQFSYSSFLELLKRTSNKEIQAIVDTAALVGNVTTLNNKTLNLKNDYGNYTLNLLTGDSLNFSDNARQIGEEINSLLGYQLISEGAGSVNWDYSILHQSRIEIIEQIDNNPTRAIIHFRKYALNEDQLNKELRLAFLKLLLMNNNIDDKLLSNFGDFKDEAINLIKLKYALTTDHDYLHDQNEIHRFPIANAGDDILNAKAENWIQLDGSKSISQDDSIISYHWHQNFMNKDGWEFISSNHVDIDDTLNMFPKFYAEYTGNYRFQLTVTDNDSNKNIDFVNVLVYPNKNTFEIKGVDTGLFSNWTLYGVAANANGDIFKIVTDYSSAEALFNRLEYLKFNAIQFTPWFFIKESSFEIFPWITSTIPDEVLANLITMAKERNLEVLVEVNWLAVKEDWDSNILHISNNPQNFSVEWPFGDMSETDVIRFLENYTPIQKKYANMMKNYFPNGGIISLGNDLGYMIVEYKSHFDSLINQIRQINPNAKYTISEAVWSEGGNPVAYDVYNNLDFIGLNLFPPASVLNDPLLNEMKEKLEQTLLEKLLPAVNKFNKPVILLEHGIANADGANIDPARTFCIDGSLPIDNKEQVEYIDALYQVIFDHPELQVKSVFYHAHGFVPDEYYFPVSGIGGFDFKDKPLQYFLKMVYSK